MNTNTKQIATMILVLVIGLIGGYALAARGADAGDNGDKDSGQVEGAGNPAAEQGSSATTSIESDVHGGATVQRQDGLTPQPI